MPDFPGMGEWLARRADRTPSRRALVFEDTTWTYAELNDESERIATGLRERGIAPGDRVAYLGVNHPAFIAVMFGCAKLGAIMAPVNWRLSGPEIRFILADAGASGLIYDAALAPAVEAIQSDLPGKFLVRNDLDIKPVLPGFTVSEESSAEWPSVPGSQAALLMYTSGTQASPKGAVLTHDNLLSSIISMGCTFGIDPGHVALVSAPLFHLSGLNVNFLETFFKGGTVILERAFDPGRTLKLMAEHRVNSFFGAPVMVQMIAEHPDFDDADLNSLGWVYCGGAPVNEQAVLRCAQRGIPVCNGYGMTEAAPLISILGPDEAVDKLGSAGKPGFFTDVRIVDELGAEVPAGTRGEILVKGPSIISGYWNRPEVNAEAFRDGWFHTGDVGVLSEDGYLHVVDRLKDMIISGGENIASAEVERCLLEHPRVADVAVIGKPHEKWGEVPFAFVVAASGQSITSDEIRAFTAERLARFKQPAEIEIVASLPRNATGKLIKHELRRRLREQSVRDL